MTDYDAYLLFHMGRARRSGLGWIIARDEAGVLMWYEANAGDAKVLDRMEGQGSPR